MTQQTQTRSTWGIILGSILGIIGAIQILQTGLDFSYYQLSHFSTSLGLLLAGVMLLWRSQQGKLGFPRGLALVLGTGIATIGLVRGGVIAIAIISGHRLSSVRGGFPELLPLLTGDLGQPVIIMAIGLGLGGGLLYLGLRRSRQLNKLTSRSSGWLTAPADLNRWLKRI